MAVSPGTRGAAGRRAAADGLVAEPRCAVVGEVGCCVRAWRGRSAAGFVAAGFVAAGFVAAGFVATGRAGARVRDGCGTDGGDASTWRSTPSTAAIRPPGGRLADVPAPLATERTSTNAAAAATTSGVRRARPLAWTTASTRGVGRGGSGRSARALTASSGSTRTSSGLTGPRSGRTSVADASWAQDETPDPPRTTGAPLTATFFGRRRRLPIVELLAVPLSVAAAYGFVERDRMLLLGVFALAGLGLLAFALSLRPGFVFVSWLVVAPYLQEAANRSAIGNSLSRVLYTLPLGLFVAWLVTARSDRVRPRVVDLLPAGVLVYSLASLAFTNPNWVENVRSLVLLLGPGVVAYYFTAFGPIGRDPVRHVARALLIGAVVLSAMAIVEARTGWNLWHDTGWRNAGVPRSVATLSNPAVLGTFLGAAIVIAVAVLAWRGPSELRRLSWIVVAVAPAGLLVTYTRGPIIATVVAAVPILLLTRRSWHRSVIGLAALGLALTVAWPHFQSSSVYRVRVSNESTIQTRVLIQNWSLDLASQKPIFGWGYGSFDRVKNQSRFSSGTFNRTAGLANTSHDTFLTILVELGAVGLLLYLTPLVAAFLPIVRGARERMDWEVAALLGIVVVYLISASTFDMRFFSFVPALPWIAAGLARRKAA
jgi:O-antigen ligase